VQVARTLQARFPEVEVVGSVYPPGPLKSAVAQLCSLIFMLGLFVMLAGKTIGQALNIQPLTELATKMNSNQMQSFMIIFVANVIGGQMLATGAFEVYTEDDLIFSKLQSGALPQLDQLVAAIGKSITDYQ